AYFDANLEGPGIWKWRHYFDVYHHHFAKFVGKPVNIVEIGVYSGGSLGMWRHYLGEGARVYGVDIEKACLAYESETVRIFIGDQGDAAFWSKFCAEVPEVDIVIDDGGHRSHQQIATLEALLPHLRPGGVFVCEDLVGSHNAFHHYACGLSRNLNAAGSKPNELQRSIQSVSFYPYVTVIERRATPLDEFVSEKRGTEWQPFFDSEGVNVA
ncbi:MAG: class I SAM-dependent methyltransferase, partial [Solirubrobacteraceae bacterium]